MVSQEEYPKKEPSVKYLACSSYKEGKNIQSDENFERNFFPSLNKLKEVQIGKLKIETTFISNKLSKDEWKDLEKLLRRNNHVSTWRVDQMSGINPKVICYELEIDPEVKMVRK